MKREVMRSRGPQPERRAAAAFPAAAREFDTCDGEKVLEVEAEPYFFVNLWRVFIAYLWVLCYNILDSALEVPHETQGV